jgi:hypothetical protein
MLTNPLAPKKWRPELKKFRSNTCFSYEPQEIFISRTGTVKLTPVVIEFFVDDSRVI